MPIYEYVCTACDHRTDILLGLNDPGPKFCPSCGAEDTMRKQFAPPTIHYKGSGWAKKDRGSASAGSRAKATDGAKDASPASSSADGAKDPSSSSAPSDGSSSSSTSDGPKPSSTD